MTVQKKYALNIKTGYIFSYYTHEDGHSTGFDMAYALEHTYDIKTGFKTRIGAKRYYGRPTKKKRRITKKPR